MIGNEEDFTASLGFKVRAPAAAAKRSMPAPSRR